MGAEEIAVIRGAMVQLYDMINRSLDERGRQTGITRYQSMAMERIRSDPGLSQNQLAVVLSTTKQYIGQVVKRLEELGLVESKASSSSDGRARQLYLTDLGRERQDIWRRDSARNTEIAFARLSEAERERLKTALCTLREVLPKLDQEETTLF